MIAALFLGLLAGAGAQAVLPGTWSFLVKFCWSVAASLVLMIGLTFLTGGSLS